jgi:DNA-binding transcriptional regulator YiaG
MSSGPRGDSRGRAAWLAAVRPAAVRRACGIRQATIAAALGVGGGTVSQWETGARRPGAGAGEAYCRVIAGLLRHLEAGAVSRG